MAWVFKEKWEVKCSECGKSFWTNRVARKNCSKECRLKRLAKYTGRFSDTNMSSGTVGAMSELIVSADLMKRDYSVFRALSPACYCDLIAIKDSKFLAVEVRTGYKSVKGKITFPFNKNGKIDCFAIYVRTSNEIYYFMEDAKTSFKI